MNVVQMIKEQKMEAKALNKQQEKETKALNKQQAKDRKKVAIEIVNEVKKDLEILGFSSLLEREVVTVQGPIQVVKDIQVEEELLEKISSLEKQNNTLKEGYDTLKKQNNALKNGCDTLKKEELEQAKILSATRWNLAQEQGKVVERETEIEKLNKKIKELEEELKAAQVKPEVKKEVKKEVKPKTKKERAEEKLNSVDDSILDDVVLPGTKNQAPKAVVLKEVKSFKSNTESFKMYESEDAWIFASTGCTDTTIMVKDVKMYSPELIAKQKEAIDKLYVNSAFQQLALSPVKIQGQYKFFTRAYAAEGINEFSPADRFTGYVVRQNKYYLFTYDGKKAVVHSLEKRLQGLTGNNAFTGSESIDGQVQHQVEQMYEEYKKEVDKFKEKKAEKRVANTSAHKERSATNKKERNRIKSDIAALVEKQKNGGGSNKDNVVQNNNKEGDSNKDTATQNNNKDGGDSNKDNVVQESSKPMSGHESSVDMF